MPEGAAGESTRIGGETSPLDHNKEPSAKKDAIVRDINNKGAFTV